MNVILYMNAQDKHMLLGQVLAEESKANVSGRL